MLVKILFRRLYTWSSDLIENSVRGDPASRFALNGRNPKEANAL